MSLRHTKKENELKIVVLGGEGVGKSTLISQFLGGEKNIIIDQREEVRLDTGVIAYERL